MCTGDEAAAVGFLLFFRKGFGVCWQELAGQPRVGDRTFMSQPLTREEDYKVFFIVTAEAEDERRGPNSTAQNWSKKKIFILIFLLSTCLQSVLRLPLLNQAICFHLVPTTIAPVVLWSYARSSRRCWATLIVILPSLGWEPVSEMGAGDAAVASFTSHV